MKFIKKIPSVLVAYGTISLFFSCKKESNKEVFVIDSSEKIALDSSKTYQEPFCPQFHFSPEKKWMNDTNEMVFYKGILHYISKKLFPEN